MKRCPCCGAPYNGKRCRECYYEPFTEEIAHGLHTHEGEPLIIEQPEDRPVRRSVPTRQKECRQYSGRRKKTSPKWLWPILIVTAFMVAQYVLTEFITEKVSSMSSLWSDDGDTWETEAVIRPEDFHHQTVLYDKDGILAVADWKDGDTYTDEIPVYLRNDSDRDVMLLSSMDCVNGYMTEYRLFLGEVEAGQEEMTSIWVNDTDLESGNIETIGELSFCLEVTDASDYNPLDSTPAMLQEWFPEAQTVGLLYCSAEPNSQYQVDTVQGYLEEAGITLTYTGSEGELCEDGAFRFRVENHSERNIWLYTMETYVNGESADLFLFDELAPDAWGKCEMWLYDAGVERVRDITSLELVLGVLDHDTDELLLESKRVSIPVTK